MNLNFSKISRNANNVRVSKIHGNNEEHRIFQKLLTLQNHRTISNNFSWLLYLAIKISGMNHLCLMNNLYSAISDYAFNLAQDRRPPPRLSAFQNKAQNLRVTHRARFTCKRQSQRRRQAASDNLLKLTNERRGTQIFLARSPTPSSYH